MKRDFLIYLGILILALSASYGIALLTGAPECKPAQTFFLHGTKAECLP